VVQRANRELAREDEPAPSSAVAALSARELESRPHSTLEVTVRDVRGDAVLDAWVRLTRDVEPVPELSLPDAPFTLLEPRATDESGHAAFERLAMGRYLVEAWIDVSSERTAGWCFASVGVTAAAVEITLEPYAAFEIAVVDERGVAVPDALVELDAGIEFGRALTAPQHTTARTDSCGIARFAIDGVAGFVAVAHAAGDRVGSAAVWQMAWSRRHPGDPAATIVLGRPARLSGAVLGVAPDTLTEARVVARLASSFEPHFTQDGRDFEASAAGGRYAFDALPPGRYVLTLVDPGGCRLALQPMRFGAAALANSVQPLDVELASGAHSAVDLRAELGAMVHGAVLDESGRPIAGARVRATLCPSTSNYPDGFELRGVHVWRFDHAVTAGREHPETHRATRTDALGRYTLAGLQPGRTRIEVFAPGFALERRAFVAAAQLVELAHTLARAGEIRGTFPHGSYLGVVKESEPFARQIAILPADGAFCFPGLEPGTWWLAACHSDSTVEPVRLAQVAVRSGETTWIDLGVQARWPHALEGTVVDSGGAVEGASVRWYGRRTRTDARGGFRFGTTHPPSPHLEVEVSHALVLTSFDGPRDAFALNDGGLLLELGAHELSVRTLDHEGAPVEAQVELSVAPDRAPVTRRARVGELTASHGAALISHLPAGAVEVRATFPDGSQAVATGNVPQQSVLELRAPPAARIEVRVVDEHGVPAADLEVLARTWEGPGDPPLDRAEFLAGPGSQGTATTDREGRATLRGVTAGEVLLMAHGMHATIEATPPIAVERLRLLRGQDRALELVLRRP
jgi:protocatechuate 3,4-dioxygenase beta subunit